MQWYLVVVIHHCALVTRVKALNQDSKLMSEGKTCPLNVAQQVVRV